MDEPYGTYVDDEYVDNHDYDDDTDGDTDDDIDDDTDDDNDHKKDCLLLLVLLPPRPDLAMPGQAGPSQAKPGALQNIFLGGTVKKTSGARPIFLDTGTVPNLVFLGRGGRIF